MIRLMKAAVRGVKAELAAGHSGWDAVVSGSALPVFGRRSHAGTTVSPETAMTLSAVWGCVTRTASVASVLPFDMYRRGAGKARERVENDLSEILSVSPNREQTSLEFWESMIAHMMLRGNGCAERLMIGNRLVGLRPLINCTPLRNSDGALVYDYVDRGKKYRLPSEKVFHLRGFGAGDGLGLSAVQYGVQSMGSALAADEVSGSFFSNAMMPAGVLHTDKTLTSEQRENLQAMLEAYTGSKRAGKIIALEAGLKYDQLQMKPEDAQLLATRRFQVEDVCRWFGTPPIVIGHSADGQTMWGSGVEAIMSSWLTLGLNPMLRRIEDRVLKDLLRGQIGSGHYVEFNREAMLQMDSKAKGEMLAKLVSNGIISRDEARAKINEAARGGAADELLAQLAMAPIDQLRGNDT